MEINTERFYSNLFRSSTPVSSPIIPTGEAPPRVLPSEVRVAIKSMKPGTAPGPDFISADFLRAGGHPLHIITRISRTLDEAQPQEQAGFRQGFSCFDHIQTVSRVIEVCREYRLPLVLIFVDYEKAFDSVETNAILSALVDQGVDASYVRTLANCYERCTTRIQLFHRPLTIPIGKGVRQGDTISPKLFTAALQWIMKSLSWEERGIRVDGRFLSNLRFTDDIVLFSSSTNEAETMLNELNEAGKRIGLRINRKKTQFMKNAHCEDGGVQLEGSQIVETPSYVYLRRSMNMENDLKEELNRRMRAAWAAFAAVSEATDQMTDQDLRVHLFNSTVLPALCYAAETWADTAATSRKGRATMLLNYTFSVEYINTKDFGQGDALLRLVSSQSSTVEETTQSSFMPKQDENAYKKFGLLAYDGFRHRKTRQDLPKMCIRGKGYGPTTDDTIYLTWRPTPSGRSSHRISSLHSAVPEESSTFVRRHSIHKGTDKENALCRPSKKDSPGEGCRLQTELDLMLLSRDLTNGARYVKMESQSNRRNGARRRSFKINDAIFAKDYRVRKPTWTLDFITRHTTYTVRAGNEVWTQHAKPVAIQDRHNGE
ncbi:hypothetical protein RB195_006958 [Necator americanus]|uniref:Reverse transcriptase domain-containing protein n=1 Tax=Necator americanus TaxID=51031 RepID=A0ABR1BV01_NECAM